MRLTPTIALGRIQTKPFMLHNFAEDVLRGIRSPKVLTIKVLDTKMCKYTTVLKGSLSLNRSQTLTCSGHSRGSGCKTRTQGSRGNPGPAGGASRIQGAAEGQQGSVGQRQTGFWGGVGDGNCGRKTGWVANGCEEGGKGDFPGAAMVKEKEKELDDLVEEVSAFKVGDPKNARFSKEEEKLGEGKGGGGGEGGRGSGRGGWNRWLIKILIAVLKVDKESAAQRKMETIAQGAIESPVRGSSTLIEFATELDKGVKFAIWQAKVLWKGDLLTQALTRYELMAFSNFKKGLKMVETASWNFLDDEEEHPLKKVLTKLRSGAAVGPVVPALPVKAKKQVLEEEEEDEEEEVAPRPQKKKRGGKPAEVAVVEESGADPQLVALIGEVKSLASAVVGKLHEPAVNPSIGATFLEEVGIFRGEVRGEGGAEIFLEVEIFQGEVDSLKGEAVFTEVGAISRAATFQVGEADFLAGVATSREEAMGFPTEEDFWARGIIFRAEATFLEMRATFLEMRATFLEMQATFLEMRATFREVRVIFLEVEAEAIFRGATAFQEGAKGIFRRACQFFGGQGNFQGAKGIFREGAAIFKGDEQVFRGQHSHSG